MGIIKEFDTFEEAGSGGKTDGTLEKCGCACGSSDACVKENVVVIGVAHFVPVRPNEDDSTSIEGFVILLRWDGSLLWNKTKVPVRKFEESLFSIERSMSRYLKHVGSGEAFPDISCFFASFLDKNFPFFLISSLAMARV